MKSHNNKSFIELACLVRIGKILVSFFFWTFLDRAEGKVHKLPKKELHHIFPIRTAQASSITHCVYTVSSVVKFRVRGVLLKGTYSIFCFHNIYPQEVFSLDNFFARVTKKSDKYFSGKCLCWKTGVPVFICEICQIWIGMLLCRWVGKENL